MCDIIIGQVTETYQNTSKKSGKPWLKLQLRTSTGNICASMFDVGDSDEYPKRGDILNIDTYKDQRQTAYNNIVIELGGFKKITKEEVPAEQSAKVLGLFKPSAETILSARSKLVDQSYYSLPFTHQFVQECLKIVADNFYTCPAARSVHHSFESGLLIHTAEVLTLAAAHASAIPNKHLFSMDVICASAILHDIGKTCTYYMDDVNCPGCAIEENTIGHAYYGMSLVHRIGTKANLVPRWFVAEVLHVIAAHHNRVEYGAIKVPQSLEAIIVSQADYLSSRIGMIEKQIGEGPLDPKGFGVDDRKMYVTESLSKYQELLKQEQQHEVVKLE